MWRTTRTIRFSSTRRSKELVCRRSGERRTQRGKGFPYLRALVAMGRMSPVALPDLVLLDAVMPRGGGFEVLRFIRNTPELKGLTVVVFSGGFDPDHREEAQRL